MSPDDVAALSAGRLDAVLLDSKLTIPEIRPGTVSRADLVAATRSNARRFVGITAPAGYGKTTLLAEWATTESRPVAWVSLDRFDDDPASLLMLIASAFARIVPGGSSVVDDMVSGLGGSALGRAAPRLASALRSSPSPFVLILDDLHELRSPSCHDVLSVVLSGIPQGSQLLSSSRDEQPHLTRIQGGNDVDELVVADLALDAAGAQDVFAAAQVAVSPETAATIAARTEGWPVGIYLASLMARDDEHDAVTVSGDDRFVADYLQRESFDRLPEETQRFLRRTSVLERMSAPLCDAVLGTPGSQDHLQRLTTSNHFLIPLDHRGDWFRYHALFREFLLAELARAEPDIREKLHLRAADWFEEHGSPASAVEHLLTTRQHERAAHLVSALVLPTYQAGQIATAQRWLEQLGDEAIETYPPLAVLAGYIAVFGGQTNQAQRWAAMVDAASFEHTPLDGTASFDSARAMFRATVCANGPEQMRADAASALAVEPLLGAWRDNAELLVGEAELLSGDVDRAEALFSEAVTTASGNGNADAVVFSAGELAVMDMNRGRWSSAAAHVSRALDVADRHRQHDYATSVVAFAAAARLAAHRGDTVTAHKELTRGMRARPICTFVLPFIAVRARLELAKVWSTLGDVVTARHLLREIDDVLRIRPALGTLVDEVSVLRDALTSAVHQVSGSSPLTPAELRLLPYLQTHLSIREIGERLFVSRNTASTEIGSIYRKLGVSSRGDAVRRATAVGLLGE